MTSLYAVIKDDRIAYYSEDEEKTRFVAGKTNGDFSRMYIFGGGELTTFNLEPRTTEEVHNYINRLVAVLVRLKELNEDVGFENANLVAQLKHRSRVVEKLKDALKKKGSIHETELNHLLTEAENVS